MYSVPNFSEHKKHLREYIVDVASEEFGSEFISKVTIPSKAELSNSTKYDLLSWDPIVHMSKKDDQSILSFNEQKYAISICKKIIDTCTSLSNIFTKLLYIRGFSGAGKTWLVLIIEIDAICRVLTISKTVMMAKRLI